MKTTHASFRKWAAAQQHPGQADTITCPRCFDLNHYGNERCTSCNAILGASKCVLCGAPISHWGTCKAHSDLPTEAT